MGRHRKVPDYWQAIRKRALGDVRQGRRSRTGSAGLGLRGPDVAAGLDQIDIARPSTWGDEPD